MCCYAQVDDPEALDKTKEKKGQTTSIEGEEEKSGEMSYTERATTRTQCRKLTKSGDAVTVACQFSQCACLAAKLDCKRFLDDRMYQ